MITRILGVSICAF
uniref:Uncharacterized protein n=1 Tax=Rhizophora mucronata TaxID=61149 RepID=A0A2P2NSD3_RHIMU